MSLFESKRIKQEKLFSWKFKCRNCYHAEKIFQYLKHLCIGQTDQCKCCDDASFEVEVNQLVGWLFKTEEFAVVITFKVKKDRDEAAYSIHRYISDVVTLACGVETGCEMESIGPSRKSELCDYLNYKEIKGAMSSFKTVTLFCKHQSTFCRDGLWRVESGKF